MQGEESGNEKILKFMNFKVEEHKTWFGLGKKIKLVTVGDYAYPVKDIPYIRSMDWLSPVISCVRSYNTIHENFYDLSLLDKAIVELDTEAAYIEVVQFINAYNNLVPK